MSTANITWVISGANRGIGLGLVKRLLSRPSTTVIATVRNNETASNLTADAKNIPMKPGNQLYIIPLDFSAAIPPETIRDAFTATVPSLDHIDVLICNAGFSTPMSLTTETSAEALRACFEVNTIAPLMLFQALWPLLQKSPRASKFISISSSVGSIGGQEPVPGGAYGPSKASINWLTRSLHIQNEGLIAVALHPGWVQTNMGDFAAKEWNYAPGAPETVENSVTGVLEVVDGATREAASGKFLSYTGQELPW
ncbi:hypothetical protein ASPVEDRAFT_121411 [Aspergillus versicolor CBS 583.65]|uniref:Uncharacterized protein n=1 Tax=Aspergillus versicolor CBS 583.65 TaxID=1036611 RepID=A0A1L9P677_ASPVE|nr:uncharacterized protein ASPVEDRAFT_121411 [Aspergillus versicolor CBS 583.65]OJI97025.1 hypothetical protein ASPVEDRAFT_121411 [Aspergillus versicolor CBS 583.65]